MGGLGNRAVPQRSKELGHGEDTRKGSGERDSPGKAGRHFSCKANMAGLQPATAGLGQGALAGSDADRNARWQRIGRGGKRSCG